MNKVVINNCYGGFELSTKAVVEIWKRKYNTPLYFYKADDSCLWDERQYIKISEEEAIASNDIIYYCSKDCGDKFEYNSDEYKVFNENFIGYPIASRHDPILIQVVEELGNEVNGPYSKLAIVEIDSNLYRIDEYDGAESIITPEMDKNSYIEIIPKKGLQ